MKHIKTFEGFSPNDYDLDISLKHEQGNLLYDFWRKFNQINESHSNYTLDKMPKGFHKGSIKGYEVYMDDIDSGFKTTTGLKNSFPIPCHVYILDNGGIAFYKGGALFSDDVIKDEWEAEYGKLENDPRFIKAKEELS